jgi:response regulator RpfG family c-di-GMP phosphodiesterase
VYDALTMDRPYRVALSPEEALQILDHEATQGWLDAFLVSKFTELRGLSERLRAGGRSMLASYYGAPQAAGDAAFS